MKYELIQHVPFTINTGKIIDVERAESNARINKKVKLGSIKWRNRLIIHNNVYAYYGYIGNKFIAELRRV